MKYKFEIGQQVVHDGLVATIENRWANESGNHYGLIAIEDSEMSCTASEPEIEAYDGEEIDQSDRLDQARFESGLIAHRVDRITDKYIGDCSF
jgi:hypothetical protein